MSYHSGWDKYPQGTDNLFQGLSAGAEVVISAFGRIPEPAFTYAVVYGAILAGAAVFLRSLGVIGKHLFLFAAVMALLCAAGGIAGFMLPG